MSIPSPESSLYNRYHIEIKPAADIVPWPDRFLVKVNRYQLARLLIKEIFDHGGDLKTITSRPCVYGVFSGPIGGFAPRPEHCVGCLRCTTQHPEVVQIHRNPEREQLGDTYFNATYVDAVTYEAQTGKIPVKGAGYRGKFGGDGWDGMWTDMSEIVRPTRDGIHGREFISTLVEIGEKPPFLTFDENGQLIGPQPHTLSIPIPTLFDIPPPSSASLNLNRILAKTAYETQTLAILPIDKFPNLPTSHTHHVVPVVQADKADHLSSLTHDPQMIELEIRDSHPIQVIKDSLIYIQSQFPKSLLALRTGFPNKETLLDLYNQNIKVFHLVADYHGIGRQDEFVFNCIREAHLTFVEAGVRDEVTLIGSGGIVAAEHVPKAIIAGLDAVALDTPLLVALQAHFKGECRDREQSVFKLPAELPLDWGVQRLKNMTAAWRDQLLEILGAMGLREVRRLRGEMGRALFQVDLEREAFAGIEGYYE